MNRCILHGVIRGVKLENDRHCDCRPSQKIFSSCIYRNCVCTLTVAVLAGSTHTQPSTTQAHLIHDAADIKHRAQSIMYNVRSLMRHAICLCVCRKLHFINWYRIVLRDFICSCCRYCVWLSLSQCWCRLNSSNSNKSLSRNVRKWDCEWREGEKYRFSPILLVKLIWCGHQECNKHAKK